MLISRINTKAQSVNRLQPVLHIQSQSYQRDVIVICHHCVHIGLFTSLKANFCYMCIKYVESLNVAVFGCFPLEMFDKISICAIYHSICLEFVSLF